MKYGPTSYEKKFIAPHQLEISHRRARIQAIGMWTLLLVLLGVFLIQMFLLPLTVVHADVKPLTDRQQEIQACRAWRNGAEVRGGTQSAISEHCNKYL